MQKVLYYLVDVKKIRLAWITSEVLIRCTDSVPTTADAKHCQNKPDSAGVYFNRDLLKCQCSLETSGCVKFLA